MRKHEEHEKDNSERWLLTYSDLITLLMIFFVVMYAISNVDAQKYQAISQSLEGAFNPAGIFNSENGGDTGGGNGVNLAEIPADGQNGQVDPKLQAIAEEITKLIQENHLQDRVFVSIQERGVVVGLMNTVLFDPGSTQIKPEAIPTLIKIGQIANDVPNYIRVEGHADDVPMNTPQIPSNWELSLLRASEVLKLLVNQSNVSPYKINASGYGEYRPSAPNTSAENRAKNRKVDIVILSDSLDKSEPESAESKSSKESTKESTEKPADAEKTASGTPNKKGSDQ